MGSAPVRSTSASSRASSSPPPVVMIALATADALVALTSCAAPGRDSTTPSRTMAKAALGSPADLQASSPVISSNFSRALAGERQLHLVRDPRRVQRRRTRCRCRCPRPRRGRRAAPLARSSGGSTSPGGRRTALAALAQDHLLVRRRHRAALCSAAGPSFASGESGWTMARTGRICSCAVRPMTSWARCWSRTPGICTWIVSPSANVSGSATPSALTRFSMISTVWSRTPRSTGLPGCGEDDAHPALEVQTQLRGRCRLNRIQPHMAAQQEQERDQRGDQPPLTHEALPPLREPGRR